MLLIFLNYVLTTWCIYFDYSPVWIFDSLLLPLIYNLRTELLVSRTTRKSVQSTREKTFYQYLRDSCDICDIWYLCICVPVNHFYAWCLILIEQFSSFLLLTVIFIYIFKAKAPLRCFVLYAQFYCRGLYYRIFWKTRTKIKNYNMKM